MYDYHIGLYGIREVAERELHDLFNGIRQVGFRGQCSGRPPAHPLPSPVTHPASCRSCTTRCVLLPPPHSAQRRAVVLLLTPSRRVTNCIAPLSQLSCTLLLPLSWPASPPLVLQFASRHLRVRVFALLCGLPMTHTLSTARGTFNFEVHLAHTNLAAVQSRRASATGPQAVQVPSLDGGGGGGGGAGADTDARPGTSASVSVGPKGAGGGAGGGPGVGPGAGGGPGAGAGSAAAAGGGVGAAAGGAGGGGTLAGGLTAATQSREREAAVERELFCAPACDFYLKVGAQPLNRTPFLPRGRTPPVLCAPFCASFDFALHSCALPCYSIISAHSQAHPTCDVRSFVGCLQGCFPLVCAQVLVTLNRGAQATAKAGLVELYPTSLQPFPETAKVRDRRPRLSACVCVCVCVCV